MEDFEISAAEEELLEVYERLHAILAEHGEELPPDSDTALVRAGFATVTTLRGITAAGESDVADVIEMTCLPARDRTVHGGTGA